MCVLGNPAGFAVQFPVFDPTYMANWTPPTIDPFNSYHTSTASPNTDWQMMDGKPKSPRFQHLTGVLTHVSIRLNQFSAAALG